MTNFASTVPLGGASQVSTVADLTTQRRAAQRRHPAGHRWARRDGKLAMLSAVDALADCSRTDLMALGRTADLVRVPAGTVLATGSDATPQWWMPVEGWLLAEDASAVAVTIPAGSSWAGRPPWAGKRRLTALRDTVALVAPVQQMTAMLELHPRLANALRSTVVSGDI